MEEICQLRSRVVTVPATYHEGTMLATDEELKAESTRPTFQGEGGCVWVLGLGVEASLGPGLARVREGQTPQQE